MELITLDQGMLVSGIILASTFILIFTETLHGFHRVKVAMLGAAVMLVAGQQYGFYSPEEAFHAVDWNVVFLLGSMMAVVAIMINSGGGSIVAGISTVSLVFDQICLLSKFKIRWILFFYTEYTSRKKPQ